MPIYEMKTPVGVFQVEGPEGATDEQIKMRVLAEMTPAERAKAGAGLGNAPEVQARQEEINRETGIEYRPNQLEAGIHAAAQGASFGTADEMIAAGSALFDDRDFSDAYDSHLKTIRRQTDAAREDYPITTTVSEVAGALPTAFALPLSAASKGPLALRMMQGAGTGTAGATAYGYASTPGGDGPMTEQMANRGRGAVIPAALGGIVGGLTPAVGAGLSPMISRALTKKAAEQSGMHPAAYTMLSRAEQGADDAILDDPTAMLVDTSPQLQDIMDTAVQTSGPAGAQAKAAVSERVAEATGRVNSAMDDVLGEPKGVRATARENAQSTAGARRDAYDEAYSKPIDYSAPSGIEIEGVLGRIPARMVNEAIEEANEDMTADGLRNMQINASIADDGTVTFTQPPNVQQLDSIKRSLWEIGKETDNYGRPTRRATRAKKLAHDLRRALGDAVPEYNTATQAGADKIAMDEALELGYKTLRAGTTREVVREAAKDMADAERLSAAQGIRSYIDDVLANVRTTRTDDDIAAREAWKAISDLSSRASREKVAALVGDEAASVMFDRIDSAKMAFQLQSSVATNSRTFGRDNTAREIDDIVSGGAVNALREGRPVVTAQNVAQGVLGRTPADKLRLSDEAYSSLVEALIQRGPQARATLDAVRQAPQRVTGPAARRTQLMERLLMGAGASSSAPTGRAIEARRLR